MKQTSAITSGASTMIKVILAMVLIVSLLPQTAFADTTLGVAVERPAQVNETVAIGTVAHDSEESAASGQAPLEDAGDPIVPEATGNLTPTEPTPQLSEDRPLTPAPPNHITTDVALSEDTTTKTILQDGLTYEVDTTTHTATLTGWYTTPPKGSLSVPSTVGDATTTYEVTALGTQQTPSPKTSVSDPKNLGGARILMPQHLNPSTFPQPLPI